MVATLEAVWNRGHVVFGAACYMHGLLTSPDWQTLEVFIFPLSHLQDHILYITSMMSQWTLSTLVDIVHQRVRNKLLRKICEREIFLTHVEGVTPKYF